MSSIMFVFESSRVVDVRSTPLVTKHPVFDGV